MTKKEREAFNSLITAAELAMNFIGSLDMSPEGDYEIDQLDEGIVNAKEVLKGKELLDG